MEWLVKRLKLGAAEMTSIDLRLEDEWKIRFAQMGMNAVVDATFPNRISEKVESAGITALEMRLGKAITLLLTEVGTDSRASVVPDNSAGMINDLFVRHEQSPADVHVVSGRAVLGIEHSHCLEGVLAEGHVAPGNVFGTLVVNEHTGWVAR